MKAFKFSKRIIILLCGVALCVGGLISAVAAAEPDPVPAEPEVIATDPVIFTDPAIETEPVYTLPIETDPVVTEPIQTEPPQTAPETRQETTIPQQETQPETQGGAGYIDNTPVPTEFVPPTIPKTVSEKSYTTNYAFGTISWICVIVGLIVIISVAVSTKVSGMRERRGYGRA